MNQQHKAVLPLVIIFIFLSGFFISASLFFSATGVDFRVLLAANCLFFIISLVSFGMQKKAMKDKNPNVFIRSVMKGMLLKMGICVAAVMGYVLISGKYFNKPAVYFSLLLYIVYLVAEVAIMMKLNKRKNA